MKKLNIAFGRPLGFRIGFNSHWWTWEIRVLQHPGTNTEQRQFGLGPFWFKTPSKPWGYYTEGRRE